MQHVREKGFTLIELMIVVAIIGILASIAIPRYANMLEKSREGATKGNLGAIKSAASIYYGDTEGKWPTTLASASFYAFTRYLDNISPVKVTGHFVSGSTSPAGSIVSMTIMSSVPIGSATGWLYDSTLGNLFVNSTVRDSKVIPYSFYGFE
jgi:prepilin-type N-terminal cleavage/methylation domain-containing protein